MKRAVMLLAMITAFLASSASAECFTYYVMDWQTTLWWDGSVTIMYLGTTEYGYCNATAGGGGIDGGSGGGGSGTYTGTPATVILSNVDTSDPLHPIVSVDVTSNDLYDQVDAVLLELNGVTADYQSYSGDGRYLLRLSPIGSFADGSFTLNGKACSGSGVCGQNSATLWRFTPSPVTVSAIMDARWQELERDGPVTIPGNYGHNLRQLYTTTTFTCPESGIAHLQVRDSLVTITGTPEPLWTAGVQTSGTINSAAYTLTESANPVACTYPVVCSSKSGSSGGAFGLAPSVHEAISSFVIDGVTPSQLTNAYLDLAIP
jgi:hypothetical protein